MADDQIQVESLRLSFLLLCLFVSNDDDLLSKLMISYHNLSQPVISYHNLCSLITSYQKLNH